MDLNSPIFDRIRVKQQARREEPAERRIVCDYPGCESTGEFRAPMGRLREGQYFCFCLDHVREYNATYNYFAGMTDDAVARWMKDDTIGHRPTWSMGVNRAGKSFREDASGIRDPLGVFGARAGARQQRQAEAARPAYGIAAMKALGALGLDDTADAAAIKARYKELVKRLHPDANGGDRSSEDKLREIIRAYNYLRSAKLV
ncbi:MAG: DnaJ domain-containing protein [Hyphomicrobiales bacterium]|nr:DnaJ domain-containing protein [Hyphomicrobiales bacterium]